MGGNQNWYFCLIHHVHNHSNPTPATYPVYFDGVFKLCKVHLPVDISIFSDVEVSVVIVGIGWQKSVANLCIGSLNTEKGG